MNYKLDVELSSELEPYRSAIEATIQPYVKIELTDENNPTLWQSKFGGLPYMPKDFEYPKSDAGEYLCLLAQINFADVPQLNRLPKKGILQFYITYNSDLYGLDMENQTKQDEFRVVYFSDSDLLEEDLTTDFSFLPLNADLEFPIIDYCKISFKIEYSPISASDYQFSLFDVHNYNPEAYRKVEEYWDTFDSAGHKLLGYPFFTQDDPRYGLSEEEPYILLFQIDSDSNKSGCEIVWGDNGICNFFIKQSDLEKLDFTEFLYNWDCT